MKKFLIQIFLLLGVIGIGIIFFNPNQSSKKIEVPFLPSQPTISEVKINDAVIKAEIADTSSKRSKGLGGRQSLGENEGMLFIFDKTEKHPFWMKGLSFALDFVWIRGDKVVDVLEDVPPPASGQADADLPIYSAKEDVDKVLELNAGSVKRLKIKAGDDVKITNP